jgi:hypothetical protein
MEEEAATRIALESKSRNSKSASISTKADAWATAAANLEAMTASLQMSKDSSGEVKVKFGEVDEGVSPEKYSGMDSDMDVAEAALSSPDKSENDIDSSWDQVDKDQKARAGGLADGDFGQQRSRRMSQSELRRAEIMGQNRFTGADGKEQAYFQLKVIFEPFRTGFEESKHFNPPKGTIIAGRYEVSDFLGQAAFSTALQCVDLIAEEGEAQWVCLKVIKNSKDFFDQSLDEIKLLQYINSRGEPDDHHVLRLIDFFYYKEHLFIVSELLRENLYEFGRYVRETGLEPYYTIPRLKKIMKQIMEALDFIHGLKLIHCDIKPENIVIKSYSRCEVKLIDFGSSCFTSDHLTTYIQSRSYRAPEVWYTHTWMHHFVSNRLKYLDACTLVSWLIYVHLYVSSSE